MRRLQSFYLHNAAQSTRYGTALKMSREPSVGSQTFKPISQLLVAVRISQSPWWGWRLTEFSIRCGIRCRSWNTTHHIRLGAESTFEEKDCTELPSWGRNSVTHSYFILYHYTRWILLVLALPLPSKHHTSSSWTLALTYFGNLTTYRLGQGMSSLLSPSDLLEEHWQPDIGTARRSSS